MPESQKARKKRKTHKKSKLKRRDPLALIASMRSGAGSHGRGRPDKEESRNACRKPVRVEDYMDEGEAA